MVGRHSPRRSGRAPGAVLRERAHRGRGPFRELVGGHNGPSPNAAARHLEQWCDAINRGDVDAIGALHTPDVVTVDRRRLVGSVMDAAETVANAAWLAGRRDLEIHYVLLATRGDRLALARQEYRHPLTQVEAIALHEVTADGALAQRGVIFDVEDEDAAFAELDDRALALQEPLAVNLRALSRIVAPMNTRDANELRAGVASNAVMVDHRPARFGTASGEEFVSRARTLFELVDTTVYRVIEIARFVVPSRSGESAPEAKRSTAARSRTRIGRSASSATGCSHDSNSFRSTRVSRPKRGSRHWLRTSTSWLRTRHRGTQSALLRRSRPAMQMRSRGCSDRAASSRSKATRRHHDERCVVVRERPAPCRARRTHPHRRARRSSR